MTNPFSEFTIRSGSDSHNRGGVVHKITKLIWHEKYNKTYSDYDIALFQVNPKFGNGTLPAIIPINPSTTYIKWGLVAGWGYYVVSIIQTIGSVEYMMKKLSKECGFSKREELFVTA